MEWGVIIITRCEGCRRILDRRIETTTRAAKKVEDYFCSQECLDKAIEARIEPRFNQTSTAANDPSINEYAERYIDIMSDEQFRKKMQQMVIDWLQEKQTTINLVKMDIKSRIDDEYRAKYNKEFDEDETARPRTRKRKD